MDGDTINSTMRVCDQAAESGLNSAGIHGSGSGVDCRKRKGKGQQQVFMNEKDYRMRLQEVLYTQEFIFTKIFRKDGPLLGDQFDSLPSNASYAFACGSRKCHHDGGRHALTRRKASMHTILDYETCCENSSPGVSHGIGKGSMTAKGVPFKKHGMGKGLMAKNGTAGNKHGIGKGLMMVWPDEDPQGIYLSCGAKGSKTPIQKKKRRVQPQNSVLRKLANRQQAKRKASLRHRKLRVECQKVQKRKEVHKGKCELALEDGNLEYTQQSAMLVDDEELELTELQGGTNLPPSCSHFPTNSSRGCSLCKDLLAKFPPHSVKMRLPLSAQPWASLPGLVNKLFKAYHFLCTYAVTFSIYSFTLDDFAQAVQDKDLLLLGQVHVALLKLLLSDMGKELSGGLISHASKNCKYLHLLRSVEHHQFVFEFWQKSLNPMTWTEILCQIFVAAGFGSKLGMGRKAACKKEFNVMEKYGLSPGTLKGELFSILLTEGNSGMGVSQLAQSSTIVQLNHADTLSDLENLITSCLSGDITLFEKISASGYRLRIHATEKECEKCLSDSEAFGSIDEISEITGRDDANDSEHNSRSPIPSKIDATNANTGMLCAYNEIDESLPGEVWLLALMEGEYSDLSIEEKLNVLDSLIDLLSSGSSITVEDTMMSNVECHPKIYCGSGAKIKRSMGKRCGSLVPLGNCCSQTFGRFDGNTPDQPVDSLVPIKCANMKKIAEQMEGEDCVHPMQSVFLGSDRRFNRYWLFLGPCDENDPGHRRIYFESSDDGHWEMIDTKEALYTLFSALDCRGVREARLLASLEKREAILRLSMSNMSNDNANGLPGYTDQSEPSRDSSSSPVSDIDNHFLSMKEMQEISSSSGAAAIEAGSKGEQMAGKSGDYKAFDSWIWKSFYSELNAVKNGNKAYLNSLRRCDHCQDLYWRDEKHCRICHTTFELDFGLEEKYAIHSAVCKSNNDVNRPRWKRLFSSQLQALKAAIYAIKSAIPEDAFVGSWKRCAHNLWINRLRRASNLREFVQVLADFVTSIHEEWFYQNSVTCSYIATEEIISNFSTMPQTYSAAALWLVKLDLLVASSVERSQSQKQSEIANRLQVQSNTQKMVAEICWL